MVQAKKTAAYRVIAGPGGKRVFRFYCDISGELCCVTKSIRADTEDEALEIAWETEGRWAFDRCPNAAGMCPPPCSTSTRSGVWTVPPRRTNTLCSATTAASG